MYDASAERLRDERRAHAPRSRRAARQRVSGSRPSSARSAARAAPHAPGVRTDPQQAAEFVAADRSRRARGRGRQHPRDDHPTAQLDQDLVRRIADAVPVPLVLHGSSGVPADQLRAAVAHGMRKINVGTALNVGFTGAVREALAADPDLTDPRRYLGSARDAVADVVATTLRDVLGG